MTKRRRADNDTGLGARPGALGIAEMCAVLALLLAGLAPVTLSACHSEQQGGSGQGQGPPGPGGPGQGGERPPPGVRVVEAESRPLIRYVEFTGEVLANDIVDVAPLEPGRLTELLVDEGDVVEAGQTIGRIDDELQRRRRAEAEARVDSAEARAGQARAELAQHANEVDRRRALVDRNAFPEAEFQQLRDQLAVLEQSVALAESQIDEARAALASARSDVDRREMRSPIRGRVAERHVSVGAMVSAQAPVVTVVDESSLRLVARVSERQLDTIVQGTRAEVVFDALPHRTIEARVTRIGTIVDRASRTVDVDMAIEGAEGLLRHGMFGRGQLVADEVMGGEVLPLDAVQRQPDGSWLVWTVADSVAQPVEVTIQLATERHYSVSGLSEGALAILSPPMGLQAGGRVYVVGGGSEGTGQAATPRGPPRSGGGGAP